MSADGSRRVLEYYDFASQLSNVLSNQADPDEFFVTNLGNTYWATQAPYSYPGGSWTYRYDLAQTFLANPQVDLNVEDETWVYTRWDPSSLNVSMEDYESKFVRPLTLYAHQDIGYVACVRDAANSAAGREFAPALFHIMNEDRVLFEYEGRGETEIPPAVAHVSDYMWCDAFEVDLGEASSNQFGLPDYLGQTGTNRHFTFALVEFGPNACRILAREFAGPDNEGALVLAKLGPEGGQESSGLFTYNLPARYQQLHHNGALTGPTSQITLGNNQGAVLIYDSPLPGGKYIPTE